MSGHRGPSPLLAAALLLAPLLAASPALAHLNSPHAYSEQRIAGHDVLVIVHMPEAVPGEAEIQVRVRDAGPEDQVRIRTRAIPPQGVERSPGWTDATPSSVDDKLYVSPLPLLIFGTWAAEVSIESERGEGTMRVPFQAEVPLPTRMPTWLAAILALLCIACVASIWSIMMSIGRDSRRDPDSAPSARDRRLGLIIAAACTAVIVGFLAFTIGTWRLFDRAHWRLLEASQLQLQILVVDGPARTERWNELRMLVTDAGGTPISELRDLEGLPMVAALVPLPSAESLHLLHPNQVHPGAFVTHVRPTTTGKHRLLATIRRPTGELTTLVADLAIAAGSPSPRSPVGALVQSDFVSTHAAVGELAEARVHRFADGSTLTWLRESEGPSVVQEFERFVFELKDSAGQPAELQRLEGRRGSLLVLRDDGEVFARLDPSGTLAAREPGGEQSPIRAQGVEDAAGRVSFPYAFPTKGRYRLWVLLRDSGGRRVAAFDAEATPAP